MASGKSRGADGQHGRSGSGVDTDRYARSAPSKRYDRTPVEHGGSAKSQSRYAEGGRPANSGSSKSRKSSAGSGRSSNRDYTVDRSAPSYSGDRGPGRSHGPERVHEPRQYARSQDRHEDGPAGYPEHGGAPREQRGPGGPGQREPGQRERQRQGKGKDRDGPH